MCLNQILKEEQLTLMRHDAATGSGNIRKHRRKLSLFVQILDDHPYPHRQFSPLNARPGQSIAKAACAPHSLPGVATWENEGGRVENARSAN